MDEIATFRCRCGEVYDGSLGKCPACGSRTDQGRRTTALEPRRTGTGAVLSGLPLIQYTAVEAQLLAAGQVAVGQRFHIAGFASAAADYLAALPNLGDAFLRLLDSETHDWTTALAELAVGLPQSRRDLLGLDLAAFSPWQERTLGEGFDPALLLRRTETVLEMLGTGYSGDEYTSALGAVAHDIHDKGRSGVRAALESPLVVDATNIANEAAWWAFGIQVPYAGSLVGKAQDFIRDSDEWVSGELAVNLTAVELATESDDLGPARALGRILLDEVRRLSSGGAQSEQDQERVRRVRMFTSTLERVNEILGEDEALVDDEAPNFVGMRLAEVAALAEAQAVIVSQTVDLGVDEDSARSVFNAANWVVRKQKPAAGLPLSKRRTMTLGITKAHESPRRDPFFGD